MVKEAALRRERLLDSSFSEFFRGLKNLMYGRISDSS
jgi:hypothetical protein